MKMKKTMCFVLLLVHQLLSTVHCINEQFIGDSVYQIDTDSKDVHTMERVQQYIDQNKLDVWHDFVTDGTKSVCVVRVPKTKQVALKKFCSFNKIGMKTQIKSLKKAIDQNVKKVVPFWGQFDYRQYNSYGPMLRELYRLMICNFGYMKVATVGRSSQHRPLVIVKLRLPSYKPKPIIWIDAGMHAREWIAPATALFMIRRILEEKHKEGDINELLKKFEVWIIPMFNPDGYEYSIRENRMWRKTRTHIPGSKCFGIDPNRNFKREWGGVGSSGEACSDVYRGRRPEEAPCVKAFARQLRCNQKRLHAYFSLHSFFQLLLTPNSYTRTPPKDNAEIVKFAFRFQAGVRRRFGTPYNIGPAPFISIQHSGNGPDYVHDDLFITNSYIIELRNRDVKVGFLLPPENIEPSGLETLDGIIAGVNGITQVRND